MAFLSDFINNLLDISNYSGWLHDSFAIHLCLDSRPTTSFEYLATMSFLIASTHILFGHLPVVLAPSSIIKSHSGYS